MSKPRGERAGVFPEMTRFPSLWVESGQAQIGEGQGCRGLARRRAGGGPHGLRWPGRRGDLPASRMTVASGHSAGPVLVWEVGELLGGRLRGLLVGLGPFWSSGGGVLR